MSKDMRNALLGLVGLVLAGGVLLSVTSAPPEPSHADPETPARGSKAAAASDKDKDKAIKLVWRRDIGDRTIAPEGAPNLLVLQACALRKDALTMYGGLDGLTPNIDALASRGAQFEDALSTSAWTKPAVASMFTGRHALELGIIEPGNEVSTRQMQAQERTLAEALVDDGWFTLAVNTSPAVTRQNSAVWQGFDHIRDSHPTGWKGENRMGAKSAANMAIRMLRQRPVDRPFYAHVVLSSSHKPVRVPPAESQVWTEQGTPNGPYMATVFRTDEAVGSLVAFLEEEGLLDNTVVVFVSDHGEGLNRPPHHGPAHGRYLVPSVVEVPWVVAGPGVKSGQTVHGLASLVDFAPTMLGLLGVQTPLGEDLAGRDYSAPLQGQGSATDRDVAWTDTWYHNVNRAAGWTRDMQCQRDFGTVMAEDAPDEPFEDGCYHRDKDPDHTTAMANQGLMDRLVQWRGDRPVVNHPKKKAVGPRNEGGPGAVFPKKGGKKPASKAAKAAAE